MSATEQNSLKKLSFVPEYGTKGYELATNVYSTAKSYVPAPLQDRLTKVEETVTAASAPYITKAQDKGTDLLKVVDSQVSAARGASGPAASILSILPAAPSILNPPNSSPPPLPPAGRQGRPGRLPGVPEQHRLHPVPATRPPASST